VKVVALERVNFVPAISLTRFPLAVPPIADVPMVMGDEQTGVAVGVLQTPPPEIYCRLEAPPVAAVKP